MTEPIFKEISAEENESGITELESLCMECHENVRSIASPKELSPLYNF